MQKIKSLFIRDEANPRLVTRQVDPDCQWVMDGEGVATEKFDGSACLVRDGWLYRRHALKLGKAAPPGWLHWDFDAHAVSGHGWAPITNSTADQWHREAWEESKDFHHLMDGTFELVGPSVNKNAYRMNYHALIKHGLVKFIGMSTPPVQFDALRTWLQDMYPIEGIVWHHPDGRMAKIKHKDLGLPWPV